MAINQSMEYGKNTQGYLALGVLKGGTQMITVKVYEIQKKQTPYMQEEHEHARNKTAMRFKEEETTSFIGFADLAIEPQIGQRISLHSIKEAKIKEIIHANGKIKILVETDKVQPATEEEILKVKVEILEKQLQKQLSKKTNLFYTHWIPTKDELDTIKSKRWYKIGRKLGLI